MQHLFLSNLQSHHNGRDSAKKLSIFSTKTNPFVGVGYIALRAFRLQKETTLAKNSERLFPLFAFSSMKKQGSWRLSWCTHCFPLYQFRSEYSIWLIQARKYHLKRSDTLLQVLCQPWRKSNSLSAPKNGTSTHSFSSATAPRRIIKTWADWSEWFADIKTKQLLKRSQHTAPAHKAIHPHLFGKNQLKEEVDSNFSKDSITICWGLAQIVDCLFDFHKKCLAALPPKYITGTHEIQSAPVRRIIRNHKKSIRYFEMKPAAFVEVWLISTEAAPFVGVGFIWASTLTLKQLVWQHFLQIQTNHP